MLSKQERDQNKRVKWASREVADPGAKVETADDEPPPSTFEVFDPETGRIAFTGKTAKEAGIAMSDLEHFGQIQNAAITQPETEGNPQ
jgi:hypothetical protein